MKRDCLVALSESVPRKVSLALEIGAFRLPDSKTTWLDDVRTAVVDGQRPVLCGDIRDLETIKIGLSEILKHHADAEFALLIHASQAAEAQPLGDLRQLFERVYVATDESISPADVRRISVAWNPRWVLIPTRELNAGDWIPKFLLPSRFGKLTLFAPVPVEDVHGRERIHPDELRLQLQEFSLEHPLIEIEPPPAEWFVPAELGPWKLESRTPALCKVVQDSRVRSDYALSIIVPFRWTGSATESALLSRCLRSVADAFAADQSCEIIVAVDRDSNQNSLTARDLEVELADAVFVDVIRNSQASDWRAGFVRNAGARVRRNLDGFLLFIDADVVMTTGAAFSRRTGQRLIEKPFDLLQLSDAPENLPFTEASSSFLFVRSSLFSEVGGFSEAYSQYGCEDNDFVWKASRARARIETFEKSNISHLRPRLESDDLVAKMIRIRASADLMYRMTLDANVHRHFFSTLGSHVWFRAAAKRMATASWARFFFAPIVFILTLLEAQERQSYLRSFWDVSIWKLKRPVLWVRSKAWKAEIVSHRWREHAWKVPNFFVDRFGRSRIALEKIWISLRASGFGWNAVAWRLALWGKIVVDQMRWRAHVARVRFAGGCLWLLTAVVSFFSNLSWAVRIGTQRTGRAVIRFGGYLRRQFVKLHRLRGTVAKVEGYLKRLSGETKRQISKLHRYRGTLERVKGDTKRHISKLHRYRGAFEQIRGASRKFSVVYVVVPVRYVATRPHALWTLHSWRLTKLAKDLNAEAWIFSEPTAWFKLKTPRFYRWVWRPVLKIRYFLEYHLVTRWRNT